MTDYMKVRKAFMAAKLDVYELEALKGLVDAEIRYEEAQTKLWTIAGKYRLDLRDQFDILKLALASSNIRVAVDRPKLTDFGEISWYISLKGLYPGRLKLDIDGVWSISEFKNRAVDAPKYTLAGLLARRQMDPTGWKLAS
jgi:hypothetical protein